MSFYDINLAGQRALSESQQLRNRAASSAEGAQRLLAFNKERLVDFDSQLSQIGANQKVLDLAGFQRDAVSARVSIDVIIQDKPYTSLAIFRDKDTGALMVAGLREDGQGQLAVSPRFAQTLGVIDPRSVAANKLELALAGLLEQLAAKFSAVR